MCDTVEKLLKLFMFPRIKHVSMSYNVVDPITVDGDSDVGIVIPMIVNVDFFVEGVRPLVPGLENQIFLVV